MVSPVTVVSARRDPHPRPPRSYRLPRRGLRAVGSVPCPSGGCRPPAGSRPPPPCFAPGPPRRQLCLQRCASFPPRAAFRLAFGSHFVVVVVGRGKKKKKGISASCAARLLSGVLLGSAVTPPRSAACPTRGVLGPRGAARCPRLPPAAAPPPPRSASPWWPPCCAPSGPHTRL